MSEDQKSLFLCHIVYPDHIIHLTKSYWLIGWNIDQFKCVTAFAIEKSSITISALEGALQQAFSDESFLMYQFSYISCHPIVLGEWVPQVSEDYLPDSEQQTRGIWITLTKGEKHFNSNKSHHPQLHMIFSLGNRYETSVYMLGYPKVDTDRMHSIALSTQPNINPWITVGVTNYSNDSSAHSVSNCTELELIIGLINYSQDLDALVNHYLSTSIPHNADIDNDTFSLRQFNPSFSGKVITGLAYIWYVCLSIIQNVITQPRVFLSYCSEHLAWKELQLNINNHNKNTHGHSSCSTYHRHVISLELVSMTCLELTTRINMIRTCLRDTAMFIISWDIHPKLRAFYWRSVMSIMLYCIIDIVLGIVLGYLLFIHAEPLEQLLQQQATAFLATFHSYLVWFNHSGGVKLNPYVTRKVGKLMMFLLQTWSDWWACLQPLYIPMIKLLGCIGSMGVSVLIGLLLDLFQVFAWPIAALNTLYAYQFNFHIQVVYSLWLLFKGQKNNVLRYRVDTCTYDQDLLPFGIVIFCIMLFMLPSFALYYYFLACIQVSITMIKYAAFALLTVMKHIPYDSGYKRILCNQPIARVDAVELHCIGLHRHSFAENRDSSHCSPTASQHLSSIARGAKPTTTTSDARIQGKDRVGQLQTIEGLLQDMSPRGAKQRADFVITSIASASGSNSSTVNNGEEDAADHQGMIEHDDEMVALKEEAITSEELHVPDSPSALHMPDIGYEFDSEMCSPLSTGMLLHNTQETADVDLELFKEVKPRVSSFQHRVGVGRSAAAQAPASLMVAEERKAVDTASSPSASMTSLSVVEGDLTAACTLLIDKGKLIPYSYLLVRLTIAIVV